MMAYAAARQLIWKFAMRGDQWWRPWSGKRSGARFLRGGFATSSCALSILEAKTLDLSTS
jgi:hypothetical protein